MNVDAKIVARMRQLIAEGERLYLDLTSHARRDDIGDTAGAMQWQVSTQSLIGRVFGKDSEHYTAFQRNRGADDISVKYGNGVLRAALDDYEHGHLFEVRQLIRAET